MCELCGSAGKSNFSNTQWKRPQYETRCCKKCTTGRRGAQVTSRATADITIISSPHGRQRREERGVAKSELQAAVKYGIRTRARSDQDGNQRWKYTYKGVVFLTDKTGKKEITSYPENRRKSAAMPPVPHLRHNAPAYKHRPAAVALSRAELLRSPSKWTSHTIVVIDQSGSMRTNDVAGFSTRSHAVWSKVSKDLVERPVIQRGAAASTDVVTVIAMRDDAEIVIDRSPMNMELASQLLSFSGASKPRSHGRYVPALTLAETCLNMNTCGSCNLGLLFLSDGKPSDRVPRGKGRSMMQKHCTMMSDVVGELSSSFGRRLSIGAIGFAEEDEFDVMRAMVETAREYGVKANFSLPSLSGEGLGTSISWLTTSMTETKMELTAVGTTTQRVVRTVRRDKKNEPSNRFYNADDWLLFKRVARCSWELDGDDVRVLPLIGKERGAVGAAFKKNIFDEGGERMVHMFREIDRDHNFVGDAFVAKESRFVETGSAESMEFHKLHVKMQDRAGKLAERFNAQVSTVARTGSPVVNYLKCFVYVCVGASGTKFPLHVEKLLNWERFTKFNDNKGGVSSDWVAAEAKARAKAQRGEGGGGGLGEFLEDDETEEEDSEEDSEADYFTPLNFMRRLKVDHADVPQAFTHFTFQDSGGQMLVCDLQGVFERKMTPPVFLLTDPVIHFASRHHGGRTHKYGRTDRGMNGMRDFFRTHKCNALCHALGLTMRV